MRFIRTILVRLYVDTDTPDRLCGELRSVEEQTTFTFKNEAGLGELLHRLSCQAVEINPIQTPHNKEVEA